MKTKLCVLAATLLLMAVPSFGQVASRPCVQGTLASYIALGPVGCSLDGVTFANFAYASTSTAGISPNQIIVNPVPSGPVIDPPLFRGLNFTAPWRVASGASEQSVISYTATPFAPVAFPSSGLLTLTLGNSTVSGIIGSATVTETTNVGTLSVFDRCADACSLKKTDQLKFSPITVLHVTNTVALSGGTGGASLSSFAADYNLCPACVEPQ